MEESSPAMPIRIKLNPKFSFDFLGVSVGVEFPPSHLAVLDRPPVSDGRFDRARQIAGECLAALQADDLPRAVERLMALADEHATDQRIHAVRASNRVRVFVLGSQALSERRRSERKDEIVGMILDAVAVYQDIADDARRPTRSLAGTDNAALRTTDGTSSAVVTARNDGASGDEPAPAVRCSNLGWSVGDRRILRDVTVDLMNGSIVGVVGCNGAGKTTLLRLLARDLWPTCGSVSYTRLAGRGFRFERVLDRIAYVPQLPLAFAGGLEYHLRKFAALRGLEGQALSDEVEYIIERFGLGGQRDARWSTLAGGFRTRVDLARATLASPEILILDEPLGPLDSFAQRDYLRHLRDLADSRRDVCVLITSQDMHAVADIADHLIVISDGAVVFSGPPARIEQAYARRAYEFSGRLTLTDLEGAFAGLPHFELRDEGKTRVLITEVTVTADDVLQALMARGETVTYFRDLSRSPHQLLEDVGHAGPAGADADD